MVQICKNIADAAWFQNFIIAVICFAGLLVGVQTYEATSETVQNLMPTLDVVDKVILWIFVAEIVIKMGAEGGPTKWWRYFLDPWNIFDFTIVAVCFLPFGGEGAAVLRLLRLLRVLKLVRALPRLQVLVGALLKSIPSMAYVSILLVMLFYVYACAAVFLFGGNDPVHFGHLPISMLSLFRVVTGEDWTDVMYIAMNGCAHYGYEGMEELCVASKGYPVFGALFFVSFMLSGAMIILNLFIGVILTGMDEAAIELEREQLAAGGLSSGQHLKSLARQLEEIQKKIELLAED